MSKKRYAVRMPRHAAGIKVGDVRCTMGGNWWTKRWRMALDAMNINGRLGRAMVYATAGQVTSIDIRGNRVSASVVGVRAEPYRVSCVFRTPTASARRRIVSRIKGEPMLVARILAGDLPLEVEEIFRSEGLSLFPGGKLARGEYDVTTECSCPDYANPCKHCDAVLLVLGEEVGRRPMTLLELRGLTESELIDD